MPCLTKNPESNLYVAKIYPNNNFNGDPLLGCGRYYTVQNIYRTLMYFDISSVSSNIFINKAILKLYIKNNYNTSIAKPITIHKVLESFDENTVTYSTQPLIEDNPYASLDITDEVDEFIELDITDLLIEWYLSPNTNYGIMIKGLETETSLVGFTSTFYNQIDKFPSLEINFEYNDGLSEYPEEIVTLLSTDDFVNSYSIPLGPNIGTFAIENKGDGAISVRIQLSNDNINWLDDKLPYVSDYILLKDDNVILTTTAYMEYARVLITHAPDYPVEEATARIYKSIKV
ncbi:DNRLRE domain-containing protein [Clostridium botulinum]|nr:DNRLRE domain-containing protein [Clostridium botulinum]